MVGTDYPYLTVGQNADGLAKVLEGADLQAVQCGNALRLFPRYKR